MRLLNPDPPFRYYLTRDPDLCDPLSITARDEPNGDPLTCHRTFDVAEAALLDVKRDDLADGIEPAGLRQAHLRTTNGLPPCDPDLSLMLRAFLLAHHYRGHKLDHICPDDDGRLAIHCEAIPGFSLHCWSVR